MILSIPRPPCSLFCRVTLSDFPSSELFSGSLHYIIKIIICLCKTVLETIVTIPFVRNYYLISLFLVSLSERKILLFFSRILGPSLPLFLETCLLLSLKAILFSLQDPFKEDPLECSFVDAEFS